MFDFLVGDGESDILLFVSVMMLGLMFVFRCLYGVGVVLMMVTYSFFNAFIVIWFKKYMYVFSFLMDVGMFVNVYVWYFFVFFGCVFVIVFL